MTQLSILLLGSPQFALAGQPVTGFKSDKVRALLAYLAVEADRPHRREVLAALLWPDTPDRAARNNLRDVLSNLRQVTGDRGADPPFLLTTRDTMQFNVSSDYWLDVAAFRALLAANPGDQSAPQRLEEAVALYRGGFLEGFSLKDSPTFEDWCLLTREQLQRQALMALRRLAGYYEERGEYGPACDYAWRRVELEPWEEEAHQQLMRLLALGGQRGAALAQYETCCRLLAEELGVGPAEETTRLYEQIRDGELEYPPGAVSGQEARQVGECPYRGLAAFQEADAPFFFGREDFTRRLKEALKQQPMIVAVVGSSGSGKSSTVFAGLLPELRDDTDWLIAHFRPGDQPFYAQAAALLPMLEPDLSETERLIAARMLADALRQEEIPLYDAIRRALEKSQAASRLLFVVDQFEELYTLCPEPEVRRRFLDGLLAAVEAGIEQRSSPFVLLLTLRADFMGHVLAYRPFADALQNASLMMGPMSRDEMSLAIEKPAERQGAAFETGLGERILEDVGEEPGNLPLLEFALTLLWERHRHGWLTHDGYEAIGRVKGALARYAEEVYAQLDATEQEGTRQVLVQLVRPGEGTEDTRRVATRAEVGEGNWRLVQHLADRRLVVTDRDASGVETVEVVHEALIGSWGQLQAWMEEDRAFRTWQERLRTAIHQWEMTGRDDGALLRGAPLAEAEGWLDERGDELSEAERTFIRAGVALRERRAAEREAQRQRELEAARALAAEQEKRADVEQRRAEEQAHSASRLRQRALLLAGVMVVAVILAAVALLAFRQADESATAAQVASTQAVSERNVAETAQALEANQRAVAETEAGARATAQAEAEAAEQEALRQASVGLAAQAIAELEGASPERAVLLTLEALERYPYTPQAESALARAVWSSRPYTNLYNQDLRTESTAWSPDGKRFVLTAPEGARIWDAETGEEVLIFPEAWPQAFDYSHHMITVDWSPAGDLIATSYIGNLAQLWDATNGQELQPLAGHDDEVLVLSFSPDGALLATGSADTTARIWDTATGAERTVLSGHADSVNDLAWSPDGDRLVTASADGTARIWEVSAMQQAAKEEAPENPGDVQVLSEQVGPLASIAWSPDGGQIGLGGQDGTVRVWDMATGEVLFALAGHKGEVRSVAWSPDGALIATASADGTVRVWEAATGIELFALYGMSADLRDATWSPDGSRLLTGAGLNVRLWDLSDRPLRLIGYYDDTVCQAEWSPDGSRIATMGCLAAISKIWDADTGQELVTFGLDVWPGFVKWSQEGDRVAGAYEDGTIRVWDAVTGEEVLRLEGHTDAGAEIAWSPDGTRIVTTSMDRTARVWDAVTGEELMIFTGHDQEIPGEMQWTGCPFWSPEGDRVVTGGWENVARIWDPATGQELLTLSGHELPIMGTSWSPDGTQIATSSYDSTARVWDAATGEELLIFAGHTDLVWDVEHSPDGQRLASCDEAGVVKVWDAASGMEVMTFKVPGAVIKVDWSPDGTQLSAGGFVNPPVIQRVWQSTEELVEYAKACCVFRDLTAAEREQFGLPPR